MSQITKSAIIVVALLSSTMLLSTATTAIQSAKAALGENILGGLTNFSDQIVKGGNHVVTQIAKGGAGFLKSAAAFVGIHNIQLHINAANQDLAKNNTTGASSELKQIDKALLNDSSLTYGLGQRINQIAQNNSAPMDNHSRLLLSAIGTDLKNLALNSVGMRANSTSNTTGASNSTVPK
jgi:hypothetical protein